MKKKLLSVAILLSLFLSACGSNTSPSSQSSFSSSLSTDESSSSTEKINFTDVYFASETVTYDGKAHTLSEVSGAPVGTKIDYTGRNKYTDVGSYEAEAKLTKDGYNDLILKATLTISKAIFSGLSYENKTTTYDGKDHISDVQLAGTLPSNTTKKETIKDSKGNPVTSAIEVGTYSYTCELTNKNYEDIILRATLTIKAKKKNLPVFVSRSGDIYFANGLHNSYLYTFESSKPKLLDYSSPKELDRYGDDKMIFISNSLFMDSTKEVASGKTNILYTDSNISDFVKYDENIYYYSSNALKANKSGIYKVDASNKNDEPKVTKVFEGKSDNLAINNGYLYFTNGNDNNYLYRMNLSTYTNSLVVKEKVHELTIDNNKLYCTVNGLVNDYIGYLDLSKSNYSLVKLTNAAGEYLRVKDGYLYYNYTDLFSYVDETTKGIWRISLSSSADPEQLLKNSGVNGFDVESSTSVIYSDTSDLHLYRYNFKNKSKEDLLKDFVIPEETPLNTGGKTISLGTKIYYLNMYAGKTLYVYDETTKMNQQLTTNKVQDFYIYNDTLYFNQVTMLTNNDLYRVNLTTGGEIEKISTNDVRNITSDGTYLYATHYNWAGAAGGLARVKLDGSDYVKFSEINGADNLTIKDNKLYFINSGSIESIELATITSSSEKLKGTKLSNDIKNVKQFIFDGNDIFYIYDGTIDHSIRRTNFTALGEGTKIASEKTNPKEMVLNGDYVYYYSYPVTALESAGFYRVRKSANGDGSQQPVLGYNKKYYGSALSISTSNNLYFLNYIPTLTFGDAHFYQLNLSNKSILKIN